MPTIVDYPEVVKKDVGAFEPLFENEPEERHPAEYLTDLIIAERKNVSGINREFARTTDQSCLNRGSRKSIGIRKNSTTGVFRNFRRILERGTARGE